MSNNKQSSLQHFWDKIALKLSVDQINEFMPLKEQAKSMQQEQAQLYATFVLKCVNNNLPPITFNDWINLENNEQQ